MRVVCHKRFKSRTRPVICIVHDMLVIWVRSEKDAVCSPMSNTQLTDNLRAQVEPPSDNSSNLLLSLDLTKQFLNKHLS